MAGVTGLEPAASGVTGRRSNQLSYTPGKRPDLALRAAVMYSSLRKLSSGPRPGISARHLGFDSPRATPGHEGSGPGSVTPKVLGPRGRSPGPECSLLLLWKLRGHC